MADPTRSRSRSATTPSTITDANSMRRIGEALLLAQNRARTSTERANRSEHILRSVLSQINLQSGMLLHELEYHPRSLSFDTLADWDLVQTLLDRPGVEGPTPPPRRYPLPPVDTERTSFALSMADVRGSPHTLSSPLHDNQSEDIKAVTRDVVMNLHVAARNAERRIEKMNDLVISGRQGWLYRVLRVEVYYYMRPWQLMAGLMLGFALGVTATKRVLLERAKRASTAIQPTAFLADQPSLTSPVPPTCRSDAVTQRQIAKFHLAASRLPVTFAMEDMTHLLHAPAEVS